MNKLQEAAKEYPGVQVHESYLCDFLTQLCQSHSKYMAKVQRQGHQLWPERLRKIMKQYPDASVEAMHEVCAESWPRQSQSSETELWYEMFKCWGRSTGHWSVIKEPHQMYGYALAQGANGIYYACIITIG